MSDEPKGIVKNNNSASAKAFGGVVAVVAVIAGIYAMVEPMGQRIDFTERTVDKHLTLPAHHGAVDDLAKIHQMFVEIETQFDWLREIMETEINHLKGEVKQLRDWKDSHNRQEGARAIQIEVLERTIYGESLTQNDKGG